MDIRTPVPNVYGNWIEKFGETWKAQLEELKAKFGPSIEETWMPGERATDVPVVFVKKESIVAVLEHAKGAPSFDYGFFADMTATDELNEGLEHRFEVVYQLFSLSRKNRIRFKVRVRDGEEVPTATKLWDAVDWQEREIFDMFGIRFAGHPDLRRILMDERWVGHPLRKDYPLRGYQIFPTPMAINPKLLD